MIRWLSIDEWTNLSHVLQTAPWNFLQTHFTEVCIADYANSVLCVCPSKRQNWCPLISDHFHMLTKIVKNYNCLSVEIMLPILSLHLFQVRGKGSEDVKETTSCSLSVPKSPAAYFETHQSDLHLQPWNIWSFSSLHQKTVCGRCVSGGSGQ